MPVSQSSSERALWIFLYSSATLTCSAEDVWLTESETKRARKRVSELLRGEMTPSWNAQVAYLSSNFELNFRKKMEREGYIKNKKEKRTVIEKTRENKQSNWQKSIRIVNAKLKKKRNMKTKKKMLKRGKKMSDFIRDSNITAKKKKERTFFLKKVKEKRMWFKRT